MSPANLTCSAVANSIILPNISALGYSNLGAVIYTVNLEISDVVGYSMILANIGAVSYSMIPANFGAG